MPRPRLRSIASSGAPADELSPSQRQSERAVFAAFAYDCLLIPPYLWVAIQVDSITMVGECLRGVLMISVAFASWLTLRRIHRRQTAGYDFGLGKHEQILSLLVALLLLVSAGFIAWKAIGKVPGAGEGIGLLNAVAVGMVLFNLVANVAPIPPLMRALRQNPSVIVRTQLRTKITKTVGSSIVVASVAVAMLGSNPVVSLWADRAGVAIVVLVTLRAAYDLLRTALPDLLDRTLDEPLQHRINRVLAEHFADYDSIEWCRSRQSGSQVVIDIGLGFPADRAFGEVAAFARRVGERIEAEIPHSEATVTPVLPGEAA
ncbi:cation transporter [Variovorax sp. J22P168]|uniref:cation diffusion facilitator family transporter n=1 Tax=Variovorax jilinensis TaxID=3053513 RepID=UPI0025764AC5|nr:cation transporter [Variovorax sp. J22P168]MDM0013566.1 cation transporter [Variovorax sp. J22P168]